MTAVMKIDQAGLPAGTPGFARTDGLATGALVTLTSLGSGSTHRFRLLWRPPEDTTAVSTLAQTGPTTWTFSPTALTYGTYRIELIVDEGLATEARSIHVFVVRTVAGLVIPALNEVADVTASLVNAGSVQINASENNEPFAPFVTGSYAGWWRALRDLIAAAGTGGGTKYLTGGLNQVQNLLAIETVIGGFVFNPTTSGTMLIRHYGTLLSAGGTGALRLYDVGAPGTPIAGILRATATLTVNANPSTVTTALTSSGAPGVNLGQVFNVARMYELRHILLAAAPGDSVTTRWGGIEIT